MRLLFFYFFYQMIATAWKVFKCEVFSGPYFPIFGLKIQSRYRKIRTRKNSVFGHFSGSGSLWKELMAELDAWKGSKYRSRPPGLYLGKSVLKICSKFTGEHPCRSVIPIKLLCNFIEITLRYGCSPVNLLHIFRTPFYKNTSGGLLL